VQGNLDPALCVAPWPVVEAATRQVMADGAADGSGTGHIFNLGHGVLPEPTSGSWRAVVDLVHAESRGA
jgi:uroporphyrinogen decarboxylase